MTTYLLVPVYSETLLHNAKSVTLNVDPTTQMAKQLEKAVEIGTQVEFENIKYYVDYQI